MGGSVFVFEAESRVVTGACLSIVYFIVCSVVLIREK